MRKKLIVLFSVLMLLSTALFAFNLMPMGASAVPITQSKSFEASLNGAGNWSGEGSWTHDANEGAIKFYSTTYANVRGYINFSSAFEASNYEIQFTMKKASTFVSASNFTTGLYLSKVGETAAKIDLIQLKNDINEAPINEWFTISVIANVPSGRTSTSIHINFGADKDANNVIYLKSVKVTPTFANEKVFANLSINGAAGALAADATDDFKLINNEYVQLKYTTGGGFIDAFWNFPANATMSAGTYNIDVTFRKGANFATTDNFRFVFWEGKRSKAAEFENDVNSSQNGVWTTARQTITVDEGCTATGIQFWLNSNKDVNNVIDIRKITISPIISEDVVPLTVSKEINFAGLIEHGETEYVIATNFANGKLNADGYDIGSWANNSGARVVFDIDNGVPVLNMYKNLYNHCQMYIYNNQGNFTSGNTIMAIKVKKVATSGTFVNATNFDLRTFSNAWTTFADFTTELNSAPVGEWVTLLVPVTMPSINNFMLRYIPGDANSQIYIEYIDILTKKSSFNTYGTGHDITFFADLTDNAISSVNGIAADGYIYNENLKTLTLKGTALDALTVSTDVEFTLETGKIALTINPITGVAFVKDGVVIDGLSSTADGYTLPSATKSGYKFVGWYANIGGTDVLLPAGATLTVGGNKVGALTESIALDAVFANIDTLTGARIKLDAPNTGLRFETALSFTKEILEIDGVSYTMNTLLAPKDYVDNLGGLAFTAESVATANPSVATTSLVAANATLQDTGIFYGNFTNILPYNYAR